MLAPFQQLVLARLHYSNNNRPSNSASSISNRKKTWYLLLIVTRFQYHYNGVMIQESHHYTLDRVMSVDMSVFKHGYYKPVATFVLAQLSLQHTCSLDEWLYRTRTDAFHYPQRNLKSSAMTSEPRMTVADIVILLGCGGYFDKSDKLTL